jgi:hypothetical protein
MPSPLMKRQTISTFNLMPSMRDVSADQISREAQKKKDVQDLVLRIKVRDEQLHLSTLTRPCPPRVVVGDVAQ